METNFGRVYSATNSMYGRNQVQNCGMQGGFATPVVGYDNPEMLANGLMALANYTLATRSAKTNPTHGTANEEITSEFNRLSKHPNLTTFEKLKQNAKFAIVVNDSGRLMVDGNLFSGVIKQNLKNETKYVEFKLGNPVTILSQYIDRETGEINNENVMKLTKYEYCSLSPYVAKTEKTLIFEENWDNPGPEKHLAVPKEVQRHAGFMQGGKYIKNS